MRISEGGRSMGIVDLPQLNAAFTTTKFKIWHPAQYLSTHLF